MIAEVYPIKRMPRHVTVFDYTLPDELSHLKRGDVVMIPFRTSSVYGIVSRVKDLPERGIRLKSILQKEARISFSESELSFFESLAKELAQSVSSILNSCLPEFPKRLTVKPIGKQPLQTLTISPSEIDGLQSIAQQLTQRSRAFAYVSDIRRMACVIAGYLRLKPDQKCIVLCPTVLDAQRLYAYLPSNLKWLLTGEENMGTQFAVWHAFRSGNTGVIVGTKNVLFTTDPKTTTIFVVRSSHENHGHHEQNPRFDARSVAVQLADHYETNLFFLDVMPRVEDIHSFGKTNILGNPSLRIPTIINMEQQGRASKMGRWISHEVYEKIQECLDQKQRVLMVFNKKNHAKRLFCTACESDVVCMDCGNGMIVDDLCLRCIRCKRSEPMLRVCQKCQQASLRESGFGNQKIDALLREAFPAIQTCVIDKEHPDMNTRAPLVIATSYYLEQMANPFSPDGFSLVVLIDADAPLFRSSYRASESTLYACEQWHALADANYAPFIIQTHSVPFFSEYYANAEQVFLQELESRQMYMQPPFCSIVTIHFQESEPRRADILLNQLIQKIRSVSDQIRIKKEKNLPETEHGLEIRFFPEHRTDLLLLFRAEPDHVMIDTQANSE